MSPQHLNLLARVLVLCFSTVSAATPPPLPDFEVADQPVPTDPMPEREIRWPGAPSVMTDVVYSTVPGFRPLHLDMYRAPPDASPRPLVVFVHGGGWLAANQRTASAFLNFPVILGNLARRGYVVASIEYRLSGEAPFPAQLRDLQDAIRFLLANAARYGIDAKRVALWGVSAGAQLAALDAVHCDAPVPDPASRASGDEPGCVQAFVGWFGPYDLNVYALEAESSSTYLRALFRCGPDACAPSALADASPIRFADGKDPPALLIHGTLDRQVLPAQSEAFAGRLRAAGVPVELLLIPGVGHGFIGATPAATRDASRQALLATFDFFDRRLARP